MPTGWQTFPIEVNGGLVTNLSPVQQGIKAPGSARVLTNFEPSIKGGYRRINGFTKYDDDMINPYGDPKVQGSGQTGTSLVVANLLSEPDAGVDITIAGVSGTYEVSSVSYNSTNKEATLTLGSSLASSPADKADVTFTGSTTIEGLYYFEGEVIAARDGSLWTTTGSGWTKISVPAHGTVLVDGGSQTGTSLAVDGLDRTPQIGDTFYVDGIENVYTVLSVPTVTTGSATLSIYPALASSPSDNAAITWLSTDQTTTGKIRFETFNFDGTEKLVAVGSSNYPIIYDGTSVTYIDGSSDVAGSSFVVEFKNHLFFAKDTQVFFTEPFDENGFNTGNGAGSLVLPDEVTGMIVFRDQLILFTEKTIQRLSGSSLSDFQLNYITKNLGCVEKDTIQEVGGDIVFLGPDGIRFLGATQRIGDFNLSLASRNIQKDMTDFVAEYPTLHSVVLREKSQYRIFGFQTQRAKASSKGYLGTQFVSQEANSFSWSTLLGIKANVAYSVYDGAQEIAVFAGEDGYVYRMESGNDFDGTAIQSQFFTPYLSITDPTKRKTIYKVTTFVSAEGIVDGDLTLKFDFSEYLRIQPSKVDFETGGDGAAIWGSFVWGSAEYGRRPDSIIESNVNGSFDTVSLQYDFNPELGAASTAPFIIDSIFLEYKENGRK